MDIVPMVLAGFGGVVLGSLLTSSAIGWLQVVAEVKAAGVTARSSVAAAIVLHSGPWLFVATLLGAFFALTNTDAEGWRWFFAGVVMAPLVLIPTAIVISRRNAKSKHPDSRPAG